MSEQLSGKTDVSLRTLQKISEKTGQELHVLKLGAHPLGFKLPGGKIVQEPGDRHWESVYTAGWAGDESAPSIEELKQERPDLFPLVVT